MGMYKKLVRDGIPAKIEKNGEVPVTRILDEEEYRLELKKKLVEEAEECQSAQNAAELTEELADLEEVIIALLKTYNITPQSVEDVRQEKYEKRGGFAEKIYLEGVEE